MGLAVSAAAKFQVGEWANWRIGGVWRVAQWTQA